MNRLVEPLQDAKPDKSKILECVLCSKRYSREDILNGLYWLETMTCSFCYRKLQCMPYSVCCFGKPDIIHLDGRREYGFNPVTAQECRELCPHRVICSKTV